MMVSGTDKRIYSVTRNSGSVRKNESNFEFLGRKWTCSWRSCPHATQQRRSSTVRTDVRYSHSRKDFGWQNLHEVSNEDNLLFLPSIRFVHHLCYSRYDQWTCPPLGWTFRWVPLILWLRFWPWKTISSQRNRERKLQRENCEGISTLIRQNLTKISRRDEGKETRTWTKYS